jgi:hypothetical protein
MAVSRHDNLEFLTDIVPKTTTYKQFKQDKADKDAAAATTVSTSRPGSSNGINGEVPSNTIDQMLQQPHSPRTNGTTNGVQGQSHSPMADRTLPNGRPDPIRDLAGDTPMTD